MLLYGPPGCGKSHLAHAIATASGANFLDISPSLTDGKYPKQAGMLMHKVFKVARVMAPSVVFMDNAEARRLLRVYHCAFIMTLRFDFDRSLAFGRHLTILR